MEFQKQAKFHDIDWSYVFHHPEAAGFTDQWNGIKETMACAYAQSLQSCLILCDTIHRIPPGSSVLWILQARLLESMACPIKSILPFSWAYSCPHRDYISQSPSFTSMECEWNWEIISSHLKKPALKLLNPFLRASQDPQLCKVLTEDGRAPSFAQVWRCVHRAELSPFPGCKRKIHFI